MALSSECGAVAIPSIGTDEPVFILRAKDKPTAASGEMDKALAQSHSTGIAAHLDDQIEVSKERKGMRNRRINQ